MQEEITIEEYYNFEENIDAERYRIAKNGTPVNDITFAEWKKNRDKFRQQGKDDIEKKRKFKTGIQLFKNQSELIKDDENTTEVIEREENDIIEDNDVNNVSNVVGENLKSETEIMSELENDLKGMKINAELFQED